MFLQNSNDRGPLSDIIRFLAILGLMTLFLSGVLVGILLAPAFGM